MRNGTKIAVAGLTGAGLAWLFDPRMGRTRRAKATDQMAAGVRRGGRTLGRKARYAGSEAYGAVQRTIHRRPEEQNPDDVMLAQRVSSGIFIDPSLPKGSVNIDAHDGIVTLRGEVQTRDQMRRLVDAARTVADVRDVECLLHLPGETPPNIEPLRRVAQS